MRCNPTLKNNHWYCEKCNQLMNSVAQQRECPIGKEVIGDESIIDFFRGFGKK